MFRLRIFASVACVVGAVGGVFVCVECFNECCNNKSVPWCVVRNGLMLGPVFGQFGFGAGIGGLAAVCFDFPFFLAFLFYVLVQALCQYSTFVNGVAVSFDMRCEVCIGGA